ncbi:NAD-dependent epimerase/dehydratase family protein [Candidatus Pelagibacter sp.]|nr:NAD-dependent epimerase/dehydratase family protein [Candidatus Pelagibacter sp.]
MFNIILDDIKKVLNKKYLFFKNKDILILGGTGLVGQYFIAFFFLLLKTNHTPKSLTISYKNSLPNYLKFLKKNKKIKFIKNDISKTKKNDNKKYDCIIFSAGYGQPSKFLDNPIETIELNTSSLKIFISKLKKGGKFLYLSSSEIYNKNQKKVINENDIGFTNTDDPRACYIEAKRCGEAIANIYNKKFNIDIKIIRLCLTYGPGTKKKDARVLYEFINRSLKDEKLYVNDAGLAIRRYIYIVDAIQMMLNIMLYGKSIVYNISGKEKITIGQLAKEIGKILIKPVYFKKKPSLEGAPKNISLSIKKYEDEFGKLKLLKIQEGLKRTIEWCKKL